MIKIVSKLFVVVVASMNLSYSIELIVLAFIMSLKEQSNLMIYELDSIVVKHIGIFQNGIEMTSISHF